MKYGTIKAEVQKRHEQLSDECHLFWAFSNEQFAEGKAKNPLQDGEKYVSIGAGGYMPKHHVQTWIDGVKAIDTYRKTAIKQAKAEEVILYELNNYEAFYTGELDDAMEVLGDSYTIDEVRAVYRKYANKVRG